MVVDCVVLHCNAVLSVAPHRTRLHGMIQWDTIPDGQVVVPLEEAELEEERVSVVQARFQGAVFVRCGGIP